MGLKHEAGYVSFEAGTRVTMGMCSHASIFPRDVQITRPIPVSHTRVPSGLIQGPPAAWWRAQLVKGLVPSAPHHHAWSRADAGQPWAADSAPCAVAPIVKVRDASLHVWPRRYLGARRCPHARVAWPWCCRKRSSVDNGRCWLRGQTWSSCALLAPHGRFYRSVPVFWRQDGGCVAHGQCALLRESHGESPVVAPLPQLPLLLSLPRNRTAHVAL
jgi:hypothetical protein